MKQEAKRILVTRPFRLLMIGIHGVKQKKKLRTDRVSFLNAGRKIFIQKSIATVTKYLFERVKNFRGRIEFKSDPLWQRALGTRTIPLQWAPFDNRPIPLFREGMERVNISKTDNEGKKDDKKKYLSRNFMTLHSCSRLCVAISCDK